MKKTFLLPLIGAILLCACGGGLSDTEKNLVGNYNAIPFLPRIDTSSIQAKMIQLQILTTQYEMDFRDNRELSLTTTFGEESQTEVFKWRIDADTVFLTHKADKQQGSFLMKRDTAGKIRLDGGPMEFILERK